MEGFFFSLPSYLYTVFLYSASVRNKTEDEAGYWKLIISKDTESKMKNQKWQWTKKKIIMKSLMKIFKYKFN